MFKRKIILGVAASAIALTGFAKENAKDLSYAMGFETGKAFKMHHLTMSSKAFCDGLKAQMDDKAPKLTEVQMRKLLMDFQRESMAIAQQKMAKKGNKNLSAGKAFLKDNAKKDGVKTLPGGLQYKIITQGKGLVPKATDTVTVNYRGTTIDGKVFDSSYQRHEPATFPLNGVIKGWTEALTHMPVGSTWMLYIPPQLAYGPHSAGPLIGPNSTLIFKVHLISINKKHPGMFG